MLGQPNVDKMLAAMSLDQFQEWQALYSMEPWGEIRQDIRAGVIASVIANTAFGRKKGSKTFKPSDFFENLLPPKKPQKPVEIAMNLRARTRVMGGSVKKISRR